MTIEQLQRELLEMEQQRERAKQMYFQCDGAYNYIKAKIEALKLAAQAKSEEQPNADSNH